MLEKKKQGRVLYEVVCNFRNPYVDSDFEEDEDDEPIKPMKIDIDLALSAYANSRKYVTIKV